MRECVHASTHSARRRKNLTSDGSRTEHTVGGSPIAARGASASGTRFYEWVGIFTVHDPSFSVLIFLIFPQRLGRRESPAPSALDFLCLLSRRARRPHTASRGPPTIDANRDRDRSRKNSIDANPRSERLERGRASTRRTPKPPERARKNATRGNSRRRTRRTHLGYATR